jgi:hypothetical protein
VGVIRTEAGGSLLTEAGGDLLTEATGGSATGSGGVAAKKATLAGSATGGGSSGSGGLAVKKAVPGGSGTAASLPGATHFPYHKLGLKVELLLNTTWTDVTAYLRAADPVTISPFGRTNESSSMQAAQLALTLDNRSGRFTPGNASGAYYPYVQLNTRIRVSVNDTSVNNTGYSGYRFWGEVSSWPATWDESGRDVYAQVTASGIWRRLSQSTKTLGSPYTRYNNISVRNAWTLASYWPMEDGQNSKTLANLVAGQAAMTVVTTQQPNLASCTAFPGSDAIPVLNAAELSGVISTSAHPTNVLWRFTLFVPSGGDTGVAAGPVARMHTSGTVASVDVKLGPAGGGPITITGASSGGTTLFTGSSSLSTYGIPLEVQVSLAQVGSSITWGLRTMLPGGTVANSTVTGSISGTVSDSTSVIFSPGATWKGTAAGQSVVIYGNPNVVDSAQALAGWSGEYAGARFQRVCAEQGIAATLVGSSTSGTMMGPQVDDTLANVLGMIEATDGGILFETRTQFGLGYRTRASLTDQSSALTLNYAAQQLFTSLQPVNDDALVRNDVTLTNYDGYAVRVYLAAGARSIQDSPNGVGSGYEGTRQVSATSHAQVDALGEQLLGLGTVADNRYPTVTVNLARTTTASLFSVVPSAGAGDYLTITNLPAYGGAATQKQLIWGWTETITLEAPGWTFTFNTIPEAPWESGFVPGTTMTGQVPGSPTTAATASSVSGGQIAESAISLFNLAQEVLTFNFGGITSTISSAAPPTPTDGALWFDVSNGYQIKRWDAVSTSWVPVVFDGANILGAGTITAGLIAANAVVAANIAAGAVTATQLAAGIVKAGIVDGTLISGAQFVAYGTTGEILVYSGVPASGNLLMSVSAAAGTDAHGNGYLGPGVYVYNSSGGSIGLTPAANTALQLTPGVTPAVVAGTAQVFASTPGHVIVQDGGDGQTYQTQRRTLFNPTASGTLTTLSTIFTSRLGAGTYRVHAQLYINALSAGWDFQAEIAGSGTLTGQLGYTVLHGGGTNAVTQNGGPNGGIAAGVSLGAGSWVVMLDGLFTQTVVNGMDLRVGSTTSTGFIVNPYSFFEVMPV